MDSYKLVLSYTFSFLNHLYKFMLNKWPYQLDSKVGEGEGSFNYPNVISERQFSYQMYHVKKVNLKYDAILYLNILISKLHYD